MASEENDVKVKAEKGLAAACEVATVSPYAASRVSRLPTRDQPDLPTSENPP